MGTFSRSKFSGNEISSKVVVEVGVGISLTLGPDSRRGAFDNENVRAAVLQMDCTE